MFTFLLGTDCRRAYAPEPLKLGVHAATSGRILTEAAHLQCRLSHDGHSQRSSRPRRCERQAGALRRSTLRPQ